jgi:hypothetical protein
LEEEKQFSTAFMIDEESDNNENPENKDDLFQSITKSEYINFFKN